MNASWRLITLLALAAAMSPAGANDLARARTFLKENRPFVLIAVPPQVYPGETSTVDETVQEDWANYLSEWMAKSDAAGFQTEIVTNTEYGRLIEKPSHRGMCTFLFVRSKKLAAYYRNDCLGVPYDAALLWMKSGKPTSNNSLHVTKIYLRRGRR